MGLLNQPTGPESNAEGNNRSRPKVSVDNLPNQNADEALKYSITQGAIGGAYGLLGSTLFSVFAHRVSPVYRSITLPGKLILVTAATSGAAVFAAERAVYHFNRPFLGDIHHEKTVSEAKSLTDFALDHRFEIVGGLSAAGVLGAVLYVARDRNKTPSEKFMSIRLFSQAAALMTLLGAVGAGALAAQRKHLRAREGHEKDHDKDKDLKLK